MKKRPHRTPKRDNPSCYIFGEEDDIAKGERLLTTSCPVALAMTRQLKRPVFVTKWWWSWDDSKAVPLPLPAHVQTWIAMFDAGLSVTPITFKVDLPTP